MPKRSSQREVYIRRQALLLIFIAIVVIALIGLVQSAYKLTPVGQKVLAVQEVGTNEPANAANNSTYSVAIWQGSKGKPIAVEELARLSPQRPSEPSQRYTGIGKLLYCVQVTQQAAPELSLEAIQAQCQQQRAQEAEQQDNGEDGTKEADKPAKEQQYAGKVYLTFDDGPSKITASVLDVLGESNVEASFFVLGERVDLYPQLAQRIVGEGHSIGNHSYNHRYEELYKSAQGFVDQVLMTTNAIYKATGVFTPLFRAPGGSYSNLDTSYMMALQDAGYLVFDWNVDSGDSRSKDVTAEEIVANVKVAKLRDRIVVLMHDSSIHAATLEALPEIISYYQSLNYQFVKITSDTELVTSPIAPTIKWQRKALSEKQALQLKTETELLKAKAEEQQ